jgi:hypothetical protein
MGVAGRIHDGGRVDDVLGKIYFVHVMAQAFLILLRMIVFMGILYRRWAGFASSGRRRFLVKTGGTEVSGKRRDQKPGFGSG